MSAENTKPAGYDSIFIVTKPLQLFVAEIIKESISKQTACLFLIDEFAEAERVCNQVKMYGPWDDVLFFRSRNEAYRHLASSHVRFNALFLHADIGLKLMLIVGWLKLKKTHFSLVVYEEGIGTYNRIEHYGPRLKKLILSKLGVGTFFGGSVFTDIIYVFDSDEYRSNSPKRKRLEVKKLPVSLLHFIEREMNRYERYYYVTKESGGDTAVLYLSSWEVDGDIMKTLKHSHLDSSCFILKLHPHLKERVDKHDFDRVIPNRVPVELNLIKLNVDFESITVYHHNSSAAHYMSELENVTFIDIDELTV